MTSSTKRLTGGLNTGITRGSSSRSVPVVGTGSSANPIAQAKINIPGLRPQAQPINAFQQTAVPRAAEATYIPTPPALPQPSPDLKNLVAALGNLNSNLKNAATSFLSYEKVSNEEAKKEAKEIAAKVALSGGNLLAPVDKLRNKYEKQSNNEKLTVDERAHAKEQYNLLKNVDPRTGDYLGRALQYQHGLKIVAGLPSLIEGMTNEDGSRFIVDPNPSQDGVPSQLDVVINNHLRQNITDPSVLSQLQPQLLAQVATIKSRMSSAYATKKDNDSLAAVNISLDNSIQNTEVSVDQGDPNKTTVNVTDAAGNVIGQLGDGSMTTGLLSKAKISGLSQKGMETFEKNIITNTVNSLLTRTENNKGDTDALIETLGNELANARVGPEEQGANRPYLHEKLGLSKEGLKERFIRAAENAVRLRRERSKSFNKVNAEANENSAISAARSKWIDSDKDKEGIQSFTYYEPHQLDAGGQPLPGEKPVTSRYDLSSAKKWIEERRYWIEENIADASERAARHSVLDNLESKLGKVGRQEELRRIAELDEKIDDGLIAPHEAAATIRFWRTNGLISETEFTRMDRDINNLLSEEGRSINKVVVEREKVIIDEVLKKTQIGTGEGFDDPRQWTGQEMDRVSILLRDARNQVRAIRRKDIPLSQKMSEVEQVYTTLQTELTELSERAGNPQRAGARFDERVRELQAGTNQPTNQPTNQIVNEGSEGEGSEGEGSVENNQQTQLTTLKTQLEELTKAGPPQTRSIKERVNYENSVKSLNTQISTLESQIEEQKNPSLATQKHWQGEDVSTHFDSRGQISVAPIINLPSNRKERNNILNTARKQAEAEAEGRFNNNLTERVSNTLGKEEWIKGRTNEIVYQLLNPEAPDVRGTLVTVQGNKSESFGVTPTEVLVNISGGVGRQRSRGDARRNKRLAIESQTVPLYETYIFAEQINALENGANWVPYAGDTNLLLKKMNIEPMTFFENQYEAHFGQPMPAALKARITKTLMNPTFKGWGGKSQPFYRKEFTGDNRQASSVLDQGTLIAGDLQPGVLPPIEITSQDLSKDSHDVTRAETNYRMIYDLAQEIGIKFPEVAAAQFGQESKWGLKESGTNNYWGIKATQAEIDAGQAQYLPTVEYINGERIETYGWFKDFPTIRAALEQYKTEWNDNFMDRKGAINATTAEEAIKLIYEGGYATDPEYIDLIKVLLREYKDLNRKPETQESSTISPATGLA